MKDNIFLVDAARDCFTRSEPQLTPIRRDVFKFLLVKKIDEDEPFVMIVMLPGRPYKYHAQALLSYMEHSKLSQIMVCGGAYITFSLNMETVTVSGTSEGFKSPHLHELRDFLRENIPNFKTLSVQEFTPLEVPDESASHRIYDIHELRKKALTGD